MRSLITNSNVAASNDMFYGRIIERSLALACIRHILRHAVFLVRCVWMLQARARLHKLTESEKIRIQENNLDNIFSD